MSKWESRWEIETEYGLLHGTTKKCGGLVEVYIPHIGHWIVPPQDIRTTIKELVSSAGYTVKYVGERSMI